MQACFNPPSGAAVVMAQSLHAALPRITTDRLILRAPRLSDWPVLEPIWTGDRAVGIGGPMAPDEAWLDFNQCVAGWLLRGFGALTIEDRKSGKVLGLLVMGHEWGDPEPELGWLLTEDAEGRGIATEAARAGQDYLSTQLGPNGFVSYVADDNPASARVAQKLGARPSGTHPLSEDVAVWRYGKDDA